MHDEGVVHRDLKPENLLYYRYKLDIYGQPVAQQIRNMGYKM